MDIVASNTTILIHSNNVLSLEKKVFGWTLNKLKKNEKKKLISN
jgi:hypothetical protein